MDENSTIALEMAIRLTEALKGYVPLSGPYEPVWESTETADAIRLVDEAGYSPNEFLLEAPPDLNMSLSDFRLFLNRYFESYSRQIRGSLCAKDSDLRKKVNTAIGTGTASLLLILATALAVPVAAITLLSPIAAILLIKGIDAFCEMDNEPVINS